MSRPGLVRVPIFPLQPMAIATGTTTTTTEFLCPDIAATPGLPLKSTAT